MLTAADGTTTTNNNVNNDFDADDTMATTASTAAPPPVAGNQKKTPEEILENFKNRVGAGGAPTSPLGTRSDSNSNLQQQNSTASASVAGLKTGAMKKKRQQKQQHNLESSSSAPQHEDSGAINPDTGRRYSWDKEFAKQSFGPQVESQFNALGNSAELAQLENDDEQQPQTGSEAGTDTAGGTKRRKKKKVTASSAAAAQQKQQQQQQQINDDLLQPEASAEGPTFTPSKQKKKLGGAGGNRNRRNNNSNSNPPSSRNNNNNNMETSPNFNPRQAAMQQQQQPHLAVLVRNMSTLEENAAVSFVSCRVWICERTTGESYNNAIYTPPGTNEGNNNDQQQAQLVAIPTVTFPFDIRRRFSTQPEFNQILDVSSSLPLYNCKTAVLLFEVLSLGNETIRGEVDYNFPPDHSETIAWGFLDLFSPTGDSNEGQDQIVQLFRPSRTRSWLWSAALLGKSYVLPTPQSKVEVPLIPNPNSPAVPAVFHEYASSFNRNDLYPASLCVQFQHPTPEQHSVINDLKWRTLGGGSGVSRLDTREFGTLLQAEKVVHRVTWKTNGQTPGLMSNNQETQQTTTSDGTGVVLSNMTDSVEAAAAGISDNLRGSRSATASGSQALFATAASTLRRQQDAKDRRKQRRHEALLRDNSFNREIKERCLPPNTMLHRLEIAGEITAMSSHQRILALAITSDFKSFICFYDMLLPNMPLIGTVPGHLDYVHALKFERQGKLLVSASSDKTVRVWKTDQFGFFVKTESDGGAAAVCRHTLPHPFHVYDFDFIGSTALVTCGFDTRLYLWSLQTGLLIGTAENPNDAFFRNICSGGAIADSKLFALDSDYVLSTWRPMEDERTRSVSNLVLRLRVRVPGAVSLVAKHSTVVLQCLDNPDENNTQNNSNFDSSRSSMSLVVVDASLLTLLYKISLNSFTSPRSSLHHRHDNSNSNKNSNNRSGVSTNNNNQQPDNYLRGLGSKSGSAFFSNNSGRSSTFILPDGRLIGYADQASRLMFFDAFTGELFSSNSGVAVPGASDVPLSCLSWSHHLHLCVTASALAHTDQGRVTEIVVAARPRVDGEECSDETRAEAARAMFGGDITAISRRSRNNNNNQNTYSPSSALPGGYYSSPEQNNNNSVPRSFPASQGSFGHQRSASFLDEPAPVLSHEPSLKMHQIVSHWKDVVVKRQASQASFGASRSANNSFVVDRDQRPAVVNDDE